MWKKANEYKGDRANYCWSSEVQNRVFDGASGHLPGSLKFTQINNYTFSPSLLIFNLSPQLHHLVWSQSEGCLQALQIRSCRDFHLERCCHKELQGKQWPWPGAADLGGPVSPFFQGHTRTNSCPGHVCVYVNIYKLTLNSESSRAICHQFSVYLNSTVADGGGVSIGHLYPSLKHADNPRAEFLSLWGFPIILLQ